MGTENKKIKDTLCKIPVIFEQTGEIVNDDERFIKVKIWLMHLGKNQNGSVFEKAVTAGDVVELYRKNREIER